MTPIRPADVEPFRLLPFHAYAAHAAERGADAITLTGDDFAALAGWAREAHEILAQGALDVSDMDMYARDQLEADRLHEQALESIEHIRKALNL